MASREKVQNLNLNALNLFGMHILLVIQKLYKYQFGPFETRKKKDGKKAFRSLAVNFVSIFQIGPWQGSKTFYENTGFISFTRIL